MKNTVLSQCSYCAHQFASMIQFGDLASFMTATIEDNHETCPNCGKQTMADKAHMAYRLADGSITAVGGAFKLPTK
jgi:ribosomal protein S27AE